MVPHFMEHTRARSLFFFWGPRDQPWSAVGEWVCATAVSKSFPPHNSHHQVSHLPLLPYSPPLHTPNRIRMQRVRLSQPNSLAAKTARCVVIVAQKHSKRKMPAQKKKQRKSNYASKMDCNAIYFAISTKKRINKNERCNTTIYCTTYTSCNILTSFKPIKSTKKAVIIDFIFNFRASQIFSLAIFALAINPT